LPIFDERYEKIARARVFAEDGSELSPHAFEALEVVGPTTVADPMLVFEVHDVRDEMNREPKVARDPHGRRDVEIRERVSDYWPEEPGPWGQIRGLLRQSGRFVASSMRFGHAVKCTS
jgi:hypothetical protein